MAVYVDDAYITTVQSGYYRMIMCHMIADTLDELHGMAERLGLRHEWFQRSDSGIPHYDISKKKRGMAVELGAIEISSRELVRIAQGIER